MAIYFYNATTQSLALYPSLDDIRFGTGKVVPPGCQSVFTDTTQAGGDAGDDAASWQRRPFDRRRAGELYGL
jgi:hypothetical protein